MRRIRSYEGSSAHPFSDLGGSSNAASTPDPAHHQPRSGADSFPFKVRPSAPRTFSRLPPPTDIYEDESDDDAPPMVRSVSMSELSTALPPIGPPPSAPLPPVPGSSDSLKRQKFVRYARRPIAPASGPQTVSVPSSPVLSRESRSSMSHVRPSHLAATSPPLSLLAQHISATSWSSSSSSSSNSQSPQSPQSPLSPLSPQSTKPQSLMPPATPQLGHGRLPPSSHHLLHRTKSTAVALPTASSDICSLDTPTSTSSPCPSFTPLSPSMSASGITALYVATNERPRLSDLLRPHLVSNDVLRKEYPGIIYLTKKLIGFNDENLIYLATWPPALRVYQFNSPRLLNIPNIDMGRSPISIQLRRAILIRSSLAYRCFYCAARSAALGDLMNGPYYDKGPDHDRPIVSPFDNRLDDMESQALTLASEASTIPATVTMDAKASLRELYGEDAYQQIAAICASVGWTNIFSDSLGLDLDNTSIDLGEQYLYEYGWYPGRYRHTPEPMLYNEDLVPGHSDGSEHSATGSGAHGSPQNAHSSRGLAWAKEMIKTLKVSHDNNTLEQGWLKGFPSGHRNLNKWMKEVMGFQPTYLAQVVNKELKRSLCFTLWQFMLRPVHQKDDCTGPNSASEWSHGAKALMWFVFATESKNVLLQGHAAFLAHRAAISIETLKLAAARMSLGDERLDMAARWVRQYASIKRTHFTPAESIRFMESMVSPVGVIELVCTLGLANKMHRFASLVSHGDGKHVYFEPEIEEFLSNKGLELNILIPAAPITMPVR
ncbi:uncharacterized protein BJ171DRAFT_28092 [Polychytrium aggregatum]|uniref:uncharacterized protein n=1 Tax=Polychytrium aggregatum TaxID=110093 RepID=UPI0022FE9DC9|nr:uncharacterized protein BJ171DRAFT_28092 [Polychytrium aggregatum]KAI9206308.1 hypothetical protein BJ171DRAFT_28092 [Polychytrium aggregatum]